MPPASAQTSTTSLPVSPDTTTHATACVLDCPDACSLEVSVEDGRVVKVEGSKDNPLTQGFICSKVRRFDRHLYGEARLRQPAIRRGSKGSGTFEPVSWDEALDRIAESLQQTVDTFGGEAVLPLSYGGSNGYLSQGTTDERFFRRLGASQLARTVCAAPTGAVATEMYGKMAGVALEDYTHARLIVIWGANPSVSGIHLVPIVQEAQKRGAKLVVVDPRVIPLARKADLHLPVRPGTDLPLALAIIRWLFANDQADLDFLRQHTTGWETLRERAEPWTLDRAAEATGIDRETIETFARLYANSSPAVIRCGWGQERNRNGGSASAAIMALPSIAGKFGVRGGGYTMSNSGVWKLSTDGRLNAEAQTTRTINMNQVGQDLLTAEPPIKALFVYNCNPLSTLPAQEKVRAGLAREDLFTVVFDQVMTDTARYADVLLPATTFLEHREVSRGYGAMVLHDIQPVIAPVGEARPNLEVFAELCERLSLARPEDAVEAETFVDEVFASSGRAEELRQQIGEHGVGFPVGGGNPVQFVDVFPGTADQKAHLVASGLENQVPGGLYSYREDPSTQAHPLALISPATSRTISSTFGQLHRKPASVELHEKDAAARSIESGDRVRVWNDLGEVICRAVISRDMRPGVAMLAKGLWSHNTENGNSSNTLSPDSLTDIAGGACFNDARVQVEKLDA